jgi:quercetin dioxygenase-like cupin family protein
MQPKVVPIAKATRLSVLGVDHLVRLTGADTGGAMTLSEVAAVPNSGIPPHVHSREDEVFHVVEGNVTFSIGGHSYETVAGTTVLAPRDVPHTFKTGPAGARILVATYPAGIEAMFTELSRLPTGPPDMKRVGEICGRFGVTFMWSASRT